MNQSIVHVALVVRDYDEAIAFFTERLHFTLVEDTYQPEQDKRWVVVAPPGSTGTTLLLARAATPEQEAYIGKQSGGRVFLFLNSSDFWRDYHDMVAKGITFVRGTQDRELRHGRGLRGSVRQPVGPARADEDPSKPRGWRMRLCRYPNGDREWVIVRKHFHEEKRACWRS